MSGLLDFTQAASNAVAGNVSGPVDLLALALRKLGVPVPEDPIAGSAWMEKNGFTRPVQQGASQVLGETAGLLAPMALAAKAPQIASGLLQMGENAAIPRTLNTQAGATVWHGSPHKFAPTPKNPLGEFDAAHIGSGEGAQAYGHGLYLADAQGVGAQYASQLADKPAKVTQAYIDYALKYGRPKGEGATSAGYLTSQGFPSDPATAGLLDRAIAGASKDGTFSDDAIRALSALDTKLRAPSNLYKVDLPDTAIARMLDWDKPLSQQAPGVQKAIESAGFRFPPNASGKQIHDAFAARQVSRADPADRAALGRAAPDGAALLRQAGIPGIRYLDGGSRGAGQGTSNYVVFPGNEGLLSILERNGVKP